MSTENRGAERFSDFAKVQADKLSRLPGILQDLSRTGCRVKFSHVDSVDSSSEFTMIITPAPEYGMNAFEIVVKPVWTVQSADSCKIGFTVLHSVGTRDYIRYIEKLSDANRL